MIIMSVMIILVSEYFNELKYYLNEYQQNKDIHTIYNKYHDILNYVKNNYYIKWYDIYQYAIMIQDCVKDRPHELSHMEIDFGSLYVLVDTDHHDKYYRSKIEVKNFRGHNIRFDQIKDSVTIDDYMRDRPDDDNLIITHIFDHNSISEFYIEVLTKIISTALDSYIKRITDEVITFRQS